MQADYDEIGHWSEIKLEIIKDYAAAYSKILRNQSQRFTYAYIEGFAGPGIHLSRTTGDFVQGSPTNALLIKPRFSEYHFIDLSSTRTEQLRKLAGERSDVHVYHGDCNAVLPGMVETENVKAMPPEIREAAMAATPVRRFGEPEEIGELVLFMCSDACDFMTANTVYVNGGGGWR